MSLPTFTAEASVYRTSGHYRATRASAPQGNVLLPAQLGCVENCASECGGLPRRARLSCLRDCRAGCYDPPPPPGDPFITCVGDCLGSGGTVESCGAACLQA